MTITLLISCEAAAKPGHNIFTV